jgi:iron complex outermembrane receptor protein
VITSGNKALKPETSKSYNFSGVWEPTFFKDTDFSKTVSLEVAYSRIKLDKAIQAQNGQSLLDRCAQTNDALACATITRSASGQVIGIANPLINIGGIKTRALDINFNWVSPEWDFGTFAAHWYTTRLLEFTEYVPASGGLVAIKREGTERGSPDQAFPKWKSTLMLDWDKAEFGGTLTGRYISKVQEAGDPNALERRLYVDAQLRWSPKFLDDGLAFAVGVNNLFDKDPPGCVTCSLNNYDPNAYDAPGRFLYFRVSYKQ